ncbi:MAG TPA: ABC transporter ATP-binding protein [Pirellulales bacterium]|nr:ABC transporter ATP-binding protein [Pirellulales bacterium]
MLVTTQRLTKHYGAVAALIDCSVAVSPGEVFGLLGPNGSGKTTLLRLLLGFLRPTSGTATVAGLDCYRRSVDVHRQVAYLPGDARLWRGMRGRDVLSFLGRLRGGNQVRRAEQLAERLQLDLRRGVAAMSTGMRQKLVLAAVMSIDAPVLILDEPTSNLDPTARAEVIRLVHEARSAGRTVIFSSHVLDEVEKTCDRVAILRQGKLVHTQPMRELRRQHRIHARLTGPLTPPPEALERELRIDTSNDALSIETPGDLAELFGWLAKLPLAEVTIEPLGLAAVYERFHRPNGMQAHDDEAAAKPQAIVEGR